MIAAATIATGANRPEFAIPQGLDAAFSKVLWALLNPIGSVLGDIGGAIKAQTYERMSNLLNSRGFQTNEQFYEEVGEMLNGLGYGKDQMQLAKGKGGNVNFDRLFPSMVDGGGGGKPALTPEQQQIIETLRQKGVISGNEGQRLFITDENLSINKVGKYLRSDAEGLELMFGKNLGGKNMLWDRYDVQKLVLEGGGSTTNLGSRIEHIGEFLNGMAEADRVKNGSIVGVRDGLYRVFSADQVRSGATVYINGIQNTTTSLIGDGTALGKYLKDNSNTYFLYNESRGTVDDTLRARNAADNGSMKFPDEASAKTLTQLLMTGKVDTIIGHSNGNNIALNTLYMLEQPKWAGGQGMNFSNVTYFGVAANHGPVVDGSQPMIMPRTLNQSSTFFMHTDDYAIGLSSGDRRDLSIHPANRLATAVQSTGYQYNSRPYDKYQNFDSHNFQGYLPWVSPVINKRR